MLKLLAAILMVCLPLPAAANTWGTDATDLWWNSSEGGWGVNVIHQKEVLFLTFFVYGPNNIPVWYSASSVPFVGQSGASFIFSGALYQTNGPWLGAPSFNPNSVSYRQVGTVTFTMTTIANANLTYTVDGTTVSKALTRYAFRVNDISGTYIGGSAGTFSNCRAPAINGYSEDASRITITQGSTVTTIRTVDGTGVVCNYSGPYAQYGRLGSMSGSFSCNNGVFGTFQAAEIEASVYGLTARATTTDNFCNWIGSIGGLRTPIQ